MRLDGKRVCVSGGASGLGAAIALELSALGASVTILDRDAASIALVAERTGGEGLVADVRDELAVRAAMTKIAAGGNLDGLVVSAGIQLHKLDGKIGDVSRAAWDETIAVNLTGAFTTIRHAIPHLVAARTSSIVLIGSPTGLTMSGAGYSAYAASKAGMMGLGRVIASDYADRGVRANVVIPGTIRTPLTEALTEDDSTAQALVCGTPLGRIGEPEDVVGIVSWLLSDSSRFATGGFFAVDGGLTAR